jgi:hypothetical protein
LNQRPESSDHLRQPERHERGEQQHASSMFSHSDYQHVSQNRHSQAKHDTQHEVQKGHLPGLDLTDNHHQPQHPADQHHGNPHHHHLHHHEGNHHGGTHHDGQRHDGAPKDATRNEANPYAAGRTDANANDPSRSDAGSGRKATGDAVDKSIQADKSTAQPSADRSEAGVVKFTGLHGAAVDTDGAGAKNHREDRTRQNRTSLTDGHGHSLDTDRDNFVALPKDEMKKKGIKLGDHGYLERADTGEKVPVVFGDVSSGKQWNHGKGQPEASVAALKALGFNNVNGQRGVDKSVAFNLTIAPNSRNGSDFDIASR